jgi:hypothetical protein
MIVATAKRRKRPIQLSPTNPSGCSELSSETIAETLNLERAKESLLLLYVEEESFAISKRFRPGRTLPTQCHDTNFRWKNDLSACTGGIVFRALQMQSTLL